MDSLKKEIQNLALEYMHETGSEDLDEFPMSIVAFVLESAISHCHFPSYYNDDKKIAVMTNFQSKLAMACVDVYAKAGAEGEKIHSENGISRTYRNSYIDTNLFDGLPNYVTVM